ncbi:MAG: tetratricopeptide repeat protein [Magnetococcales bacterium]|nr:tetratricopeptide repeat protein [Magnetococcales bacterium]
MKLPKIIILHVLVLLTMSPMMVLGSDSYYQKEAAILDELRSAVDTYGPRNYNTVTQRMKLADFYITSGEYNKAEPLLHQVRRMMDIRLGPDNVKILPVLTKIADIDLRQNRFPFAINIYQRISAITNRRYGSNSEKGKKVKNKIAEIRRAAREWKRLGSKAAVMAETRKPPSHLAGNIKLPSISKSSVVVPRGTLQNRGGVKEKKVVADKKIVQKKAATKKLVEVKKTTIVDTTVVTQKPIIPYKAKLAAPKTGQKKVVKTKQPIQSNTIATAQENTTTSKTPYVPRNLDAEGIPRDPGVKYKVGYFISMGCFGDKPFAVNQVNRVMALSLPVYMKSIRGDSLHCVFGGPFPSRGEAEVGAELSRTKAKVKDTLVRSYK